MQCQWPKQGRLRLLSKGHQQLPSQNQKQNQNPKEAGLGWDPNKLVQLVLIFQLYTIEATAL